MHGGFGSVNPTEAQLEAVQAGPDGPVQMINLLEFKDRAEDPDHLVGTVHRTAGLERTTILATTPVIDASKPG